MRGTLWSDATKTVAIEGGHRPPRRGDRRRPGERAGHHRQRGRERRAVRHPGHPGGQLPARRRPPLDPAAAPRPPPPSPPPRRSSTSTWCSSRSPTAYLQLLEKLIAGNSPVDLVAGALQPRLTQGLPSSATTSPSSSRRRAAIASCSPTSCVSERARSLPRSWSASGASASAYFASFPARARCSAPARWPTPTSWCSAPKGVVRVTVRDGAGQPVAGANVTLHTPGGLPVGERRRRHRHLRRGAERGASTPPPAPSPPAPAATPPPPSPTTTRSWRSPWRWRRRWRRTAPSTSRCPTTAGTATRPMLVPAPGDHRRDPRREGSGPAGGDRRRQGGYASPACPPAPTRSTPATTTATRWRRSTGSLVGPDGNDNQVPAPHPRRRSAAPAVDRAAAGHRGRVADRGGGAGLLGAAARRSCCPSTAPTPPPTSRARRRRGRRRRATWSSSLDAAGQQVVRFVPSVAYDNFTIYSLTVVGGPRRRARPRGSAADDQRQRRLQLQDRGWRGAGGDPAPSPTLARPVDPQAAIRFDFSEAVAGDR